MGAKSTKLEIEGLSISLTNPEKLKYPAAGFTKAHVIDHYIRVSPYILPHLKDRPVTLKRYPDGVQGEFFYEKHAPGFTPSWVKTFAVPRRSGQSDIHYVIANNAQTLAWLANRATLEIHPFLHRIPHIDRPTAIVFDLDPGEAPIYWIARKWRSCCARKARRWFRAGVEAETKAAERNRASAAGSGSAERVSAEARFLQDNRAGAGAPHRTRLASTIRDS